MAFADFYFTKYKYFPAKIDITPDKNLQFIIIIPCFNEPEILKTLESIKNNNVINSSVEVIILINSSETTNAEIVKKNLFTFQQISDWIKKNSTQQKCFFVKNIQNLPDKISGAGLARKIAMDEALRRFNLINNSNGIIISLDADTICEKNYLFEIEKQITNQPNTKGFTINFEHPVEGSDFSEEIYSAITLYELYLRYYIEALRYTGFPYSYHTIGSAFGVRAAIYAKQGGMNTRQAGEDFYFLHKIIPLGDFYEINSTKVIPSPRISDRVPFGTGIVIEKIISEKSSDFLTYNFEAFSELKAFFEMKDTFYKLSDIKKVSVSKNLTSFLEINNFNCDFEKINSNSPNINTFNKRFFDWFNAFRILKFLNFSHESYYKKQSILIESCKLLDNINLKYHNKDAKSILNIFRSL
jgi:hypothetical protein